MESFLTPVTLLAFLLAASNWTAEYLNWRRLVYIAKPATMLALLLLIGLSVGLGGEMKWFTIGLIFCLVGDVFLMLNEKMFIFGLLAFLIGQIFYIVAFNTQPPYFNWLGLFTLFGLGIYVAWFYPKLVRGLKEKGEKQLLIPVFVYAVMISLMVYSAVMVWSRTDWTPITALLVSTGAILFYASDSILAWNKFVSPITRCHFANMITYHLAQFSIVFGSILHITR